MAGTGDYVFFAADYRHRNYDLIENVCTQTQNYVANFALRDYPITEADILSKGQAAWDAALNTVNIGKYNLGWASIGICTHAFYEAIHHAAYRTSVRHGRDGFPPRQADVHRRLCAPGGDETVCAARRGLHALGLAGQTGATCSTIPVVKMKVTTQGEEVINLLWDVIAAKGFEKDMYFEMAARDIRALPKLEGTVHVNIALIVKFMANYFFNPAEYPEVPQRSDAANDDFLFHQGPAKGWARFEFHDYRPGLQHATTCPTSTCSRNRSRCSRSCSRGRRPAKPSKRTPTFLLALGEAFTLVVYGQLILENARLYRRGRRHRGPDFRFHGARPEQICAAALWQAQQHARADGLLPQADPQAGGG